MKWSPWALLACLGAGYAGYTYGMRGNEQIGRKAVELQGALDATHSQPEEQTKPSQCPHEDYVFPAERAASYIKMVETLHIVGLNGCSPGSSSICHRVALFYGNKPDGVQQECDIYADGIRKYYRARPQFKGYQWLCEEPIGRKVERLQSKKEEEPGEGGRAKP